MPSPRPALLPRLADRDCPPGMLPAFRWLVLVLAVVTLTMAAIAYATNL